MFRAVPVMQKSVMQKSLAELQHELEVAEKRLEAQKKSNEFSGGRGIPSQVSPSMRDNTVKFYEKERAAIEKQISQHPDYNKEAQGDAVRLRRK